MRHFRHNKHELLVFHLLDPQELSFDFSGDVEFIDLESGDRIRTFPDYIKQDYQACIKAFNEQYKLACRENRIDYQLLTTSTALDVALMEYLVKRIR